MEGLYISSEGHWSEYVAKSKPVQQDANRSILNQYDDESNNQYIYVCCSVWCQAMPHWATAYLTLYLPLFTSNLSQCILAHPLEAPCSALPSRHGYRTRPSVSSSRCDQRASRFYRHFICQPAQRGEDDMSRGSAKGGVPASQDYTTSHVTKHGAALYWSGVTMNGRLRDSFPLLIPQMLVGLTRKTKE